jgi:hypothetical protein
MRESLCVPRGQAKSGAVPRSCWKETKSALALLVLAFLVFAGSALLAALTLLFLALLVLARGLAAFLFLLAIALAAALAAALAHATAALLARLVLVLVPGSLRALTTILLLLLAFLVLLTVLVLPLLSHEDLLWKVAGAVVAVPEKPL